MAAPFRILDQWGRSFGASNTLYEAATTSRSRPAAPRVDRDTISNVSTMGFRELLAAGRHIFANSPPLRWAIKTSARLAIGNHFIPQYYGEDKEWGKDEAEPLLNEWHKVMDVRGRPYVWARNLRLWLTSIKHSADVGILLTESAAGYPLVQTIPAHRIGGFRNCSDLVKEGDYKGMRIVNGVIFDEQMRDIAYRVVSSDGNTHRDISAVNVFADDGTLLKTADMFLVYDPDWSDQGRGIPTIASGIPDAGDIEQVQDFIKMALKKEASYAVVEYNETGSHDAAVEFSRTGPEEEAGQAALYEERVEGGTIQIYKANSGSKVEFPGGERPSERSQQFWDKVQRSGFMALDWPMEFYDSQGKGGAALRLVMELAQPAVENDHQIACEIATRLDGWRLAKAFKRKEISRLPVDWWKIRHQGPPEITADKGYSAQIDREDYKLGFTTFQEVCARRGRWHEEVLDDRSAEAEAFLARAKILADQYKADGMTLEGALNLLRQTSANPPQMAVIETESAEVTEGELSEIEQIKAQFDAYGVGVRAGTLTPNDEDENFFRAKLGLPPINSNVRKAWTDDKGVRRPITLTPVGGEPAPSFGGQQKAEDHEA